MNENSYVMVVLIHISFFNKFHYILLNNITQQKNYIRNFHF